MLAGNFVVGLGRAIPCPHRTRPGLSSSQICEQLIFLRQVPSSRQVSRRAQSCSIIASARIDEGQYITRAQEKRVPVFVAFANDLLEASGTMDARKLRATKYGLLALKNLGVDGVVVDVWWGLVEKNSQRYDWSTYFQLFKEIKALGMKAKVQLCFHGNKKIQLPAWVLDCASADPDLFYTDEAQNRCQDYISLGADQLPLLQNRTPIQAYTEFMESFKSNLQMFMGTTIQECIIGTGPGGELRFPSTPSGRWDFPGIGAFQCYDRYLVASLRACSRQVGQPEWGEITGRGPHDAGNYCNWPSQTGFFSSCGSWLSPYGTFFLQWYSSSLLGHGRRVGSAASEVLRGSGVQLSIKAPSAHWWYNEPSHPAELTAGIYNTRSRDGYTPVVAMLRTLGLGLHVGNAEMRNLEQPGAALCAPEEQLSQWRATGAALGVPVGVANSLQRFDDAAYSTLESALYSVKCHEGIDLPRPASLIFNGLGDAMFASHNWHDFKRFLHKLASHEGGARVGYMQLEPTPEVVMAPAFA